GARDEDGPGGPGGPLGEVDVVGEAQKIARRISTAPTITATVMAKYRRNRKASCSDRSGFSIGRLEHVDRAVHEDPHDVDEVPVDPRHLDAAVLLGREVPAEGADRGERQQVE